MFVEACLLNYKQFKFALDETRRRQIEMATGREMFYFIYFVSSCTNLN